LNDRGAHRHRSIFLEPLWYSLARSLARLLVAGSRNIFRCVRAPTSRRMCIAAAVLAPLKLDQRCRCAGEKSGSTERRAQELDMWSKNQMQHTTNSIIPCHYVALERPSLLAREAQSVPKTFHYCKQSNTVLAWLVYVPRPPQDFHLCMQSKIFNIIIGINALRTKKTCQHSN
jgi:hypothetical protein